MHHSKLYPEHLLLGIINQSSGIASKFLKAAGLRADILKEKIKNERIEKNPHPATEILSFSVEVKKLLTDSWDLARSLGTNYIAPEHLFLSLIEDNSSPSAKILRGLNINIDRIKASVTKIIERKTSSKTHPEGLLKSKLSMSKYFSLPELSADIHLFDLIKSAKTKLQDSKYEIIGTEQIFLAMLEKGESELAKTLESEGVVYDNFTEKLNSIESRIEEYDDNEFLFTPKSFLSLNTACEIAKELGSADISEEHVLLGMLKEGGLTSKVLKEMGVNLESLCGKILKPIEKQKPVTLTIIRLAKEEARRLGHNVVGTELILLGILGEGTEIGAEVLHKLGVTVKDVRGEVEKIIGYGDEYKGKEISFTPRAKKLLEIAWTKAKQFGKKRIGSEHLLLGITKEKNCVAMKVLENLGVDVLEIRQGILEEIQKKEQ